MKEKKINPTRPRTKNLSWDGFFVLWTKIYKDVITCLDMLLGNNNAARGIKKTIN